MLIDDSPWCACCVKIVSTLSFGNKMVALNTYWFYVSLILLCQFFPYYIYIMSSSIYLSWKNLTSKQESKAISSVWFFTVKCWGNEPTPVVGDCHGVNTHLTLTHLMAAPRTTMVCHINTVILWHTTNISSNIHKKFTHLCWTTRDSSALVNETVLRIWLLFCHNVITSVLCLY